MAAADDPAFVVLTGDLVEKGADEKLWDEWFDDWHELMITKDGRRVPIMQQSETMRRSAALK
jgi:hypothetical protein